jgi:hypothetical protein
MANYKIIGGDQKQYGLVSAEDLRKWIAEGRLNAQSLAQLEGETAWKPLAAFPEFADALASRPQASGVPPTFVAPADWLERDYELDIGGCISRGWGLVKNNFWPVVGVNALVTLIIVAINQFIGLFTRPVINEMIVQHQFSARGIFIALMVAIISTPICTLFMAGLFKYFLKMARGESAQIGDAFSGFGPSIGQLILLGLVMNSLVMIGCVLCLIPGVYLSVAWYFAIPLVIDRRMNFWEAMESSRKMVTKHWFLVFAFLLVVGLLGVAGVIACCIGIFVTMPIFFASVIYAYETIFGKETAQAG